MKKKVINIVAFIMIIAIVVISSCTKEGLPGKDGTNGLNGKDANSSCLKCHTSENWTSKTAEYQLSEHFTGNTSARNTKYCARCHTNEGFLEVTGNKTYVVSNDMPNGTKISCATCHKHNEGFDFLGDTLTNILRTTSPVPLNYYAEYTNGNPFTNSKTEDFGKANNLCATCHQIRGATSVDYKDSATGPTKSFQQLAFYPFNKPSQNDLDSVKYQVGESLSVHDGNQSNLFAGINGYEYQGKVYTRTWKHSDNKCTTCHMNKLSDDKKTGGHTLIVNEVECVKCHGDDKIKNRQEEIHFLLNSLADRLVARKVFKKVTNASSGSVSYTAVNTHDFYGIVIPALATPSSTKYALALTRSNTVSSTNGLVVYQGIPSYSADKTSNASTVGSADRIGRKWLMGELGAAYNYNFVESHNGGGIHNPVYAKQLILKSIEWLDSH